VQSLPLILAIVLLLYSVNNIYTFLVVKKTTLLSLFVWNTCTPVSIATAMVLVFGKEMRVLSSSMVPLLLWFGFLGLFVFWWGWLDLQLAFFMQGQHLVMTVTAVYLVKTRWAKKGAFVGVVALLLWILSFRVLGPYAAPLW
jgi:hypothetical protein